MSKQKNRKEMKSLKNGPPPAPPVAICTICSVTAVPPQRALQHVALRRALRPQRELACAAACDVAADDFERRRVDARARDDAHHELLPLRALRLAPQEAALHRAGVACFVET